ncbi:MaoC/PaaZ C-terminal domain-containing protein [Antrihabitans sp. YC2-6]|uniref:MaoC/PaaZ C-terminal domain-containing protein n=1 Tax=Antrihabitans sp. YC2-6 TaxID=2799498 RepID=UPI0018F34731|nr:MaoC/PaaZ C-terminal domain-containing protein [Antrihabitans sp. YC2-6]MBJ8347729.1 dehydratase [Antrihabitans sp. YC2-6]
MTKTEKLTEQPKIRDLYFKAALGAIPLPGVGGRPSTLPEQTLELKGVKVDPDHLAAYAKVCGLRFGDSLPLTYPFVLLFPTVMKLVISKEFPFPAIGAVHAENVIEQLRPISVSEPLDFRVHADNLREHPKGLLVDMVSSVSVGREEVWKQTTTFLRQQKTSLSGGPKPEPKPEEAPPTPMSTLRVDQKTINKYAAVSGDRNPIHISGLGAKAFGFPTTIAHGMYTAAATLQTVEGRIPDAVTYSVKFGKPVLIPSTVNVYADETEGGWDLSLKHPKKGYPHLTATLR